MCQTKRIKIKKYYGFLELKPKYKKGKEHYLTQSLELL